MVSAPGSGYDKPETILLHSAGLSSAEYHRW